MKETVKIQLDETFSRLKDYKDKLASLRRSL